MRRFFTVICAAAAILSSAACSKFSEAENVTQVSEGKLVPVTLSVELPSVSVETRDLTSYNDMLDYEKAISSIQYLVYASGTGITETPWFYYKTTSLTDNPTFTGRDDKAYSAYVFVNIKEDLSSLQWTEAPNYCYTLTGDEKNTGFPMYGVRTPINKGSGSFPTDVSIVLYQLMSRVAVSYIKNNLPAILGDIKIKGAYIMTVPSKINYSGSDSSSSNYTDAISGIDYYNCAGRSAKRSEISSFSSTDENYKHIIDGSTYLPQLPHLTYQALDITIKNGETHSFESPILLYTTPCYGGTSPSNYPSLVLIAELNGETMYYRVPISSKQIGYKSSINIASGKSFTYGITLGNFGSSDPMEAAPSLTTTSLTYSFADWSGGTYEAS